MIGNEEDFSAALGLEVKGAGEHMMNLEVESYRSMIEHARQHYPNFKAIATTLRQVKSATRNDWRALLWHDGSFYQSTPRDDLEILDRVGGGDSFAARLIYGLLTSQGAQRAVDYGAAHGALAMTTPGDTSMATLREVEKLMAGGSARVQR